MQDKTFLRWIPVPSADTTMAAVYGGSLQPGADGMLRTKRVTTYPQLMEYVRRFTREVSSDWIVDEGTVITAMGVTSAIDLGFWFCEKIGGRDTKEKIQARMDYRHYCTL